MSTKQELYQGLHTAVVDMDEDAAIELSQQVVDEGFDAYEAIEEGLSKGMEEVGQLYEEEEYFIPELLLCSDAMYAGIEILKPHIKRKESARRHKVVLGVVEGDTHDIGKNLVKIMLESAGFDVLDLGRDIPPADFVAKAREEGAEIIALSALMTTAMRSMQDVIELLEKEGVRTDYKVMVGGAPVSSAFAKKIGADAYASNAAEAAKLAQSLLQTVEAIAS